MHAPKQLLDVKGDPKLVEGWKHANKVCRYTILSTLSNDLFDVYCSYKGAKEIWGNLNVKYTTEDATKQKFVVGNYLRWQMVEDKEIKAQINEYHKLIEELKAEKIDLPDVFVVGALVEKLPSSWNDYKQQLKHKHTQMSLAEGKVSLKLTSGKTLALSDVLHVPTIRTNLISVALLNKVGVKVSFESDKIVMTKNDVFVGKGYCDQGLFVLGISED